jgi:hypothetical protein
MKTIDSSGAIMDGRISILAAYISLNPKPRKK